MVSCLFTAIVFLNSYELFFSKNITAFAGMGINSISELRSSSVIRSVTEASGGVVDEKTGLGDFGKPQDIKLPKFGSRYPLIPYVKDADNFLYRSGNGHYLFYGKSKDGQVGNMIIYINKDWRTMQQSSQVTIDDNLFVDTDKDWRYMYKVIDKKTLPYNQGYVASETQRQNLIFVIESDQKEATVIVQAELVILQSTGR
jgi:hypothetical protein